MEIRFFRKKDTEIVKIALVHEDGTKEVLGILGPVSDLVRLEVIFADNTEGNFAKWLIIDRDANVIGEYESKAEAKTAAEYIFGK